ncbi:MAG: CHASE2 domain-containing protein [Pseudomonadota bacterium]
MHSLKENRIARFALLFFLGLLLIFSAEYTGLLTGIDSYFYDFSFRLRGKRDVNPHIILVTIDERTLSKLGRWPINRSSYVDLLRFLGQAKVVGLDIILAEPTSDDLVLSQAMKKHGKVVLPVYIDRHLNISLPLKTFPETGIGHIHLEQDIDGIVRKVFHGVYCRGTFFRSFASSIIEFTGPDRQETTIMPSETEQRYNDACIYQTDPMLINYYGGSGTYPTISFLDVIEGRWPSSFFKDKIVLVGLTCSGLLEGFLTPFTQERIRMHGVEVHAQILNNLLDRNPIRIVHRFAKWPLVSALSLLAFFLFVRPGGMSVTLMWIFGLLIIVMLIFIGFSAFNLWLPPASFLISITLAFILAHIFKLEKMGALLRRAKEDWEESFNTINDAIAIHHRDCTIARANKTADHIFGNPLLELLEKRCLLFRDTVKNSPDQGIDERNPGIEEAIIEEIYDPGLNKHLEIKALPRFDEDRQFSGMVQIVRDITERVTTEERERQLQIQLIQAQKMEAMGTLAGGIAHDFNNILSAIIGYTELAYLEIPQENKAKRQLMEVLKGGERAKNLVNQILTFSRQTEHEKRPIEIGSVIKEALKLIRSTLPTTIEIRTDIRTPGAVEADPTQIHQIIMNLCTNAYHAMREQGGVLRVLLEDVDIASEDQFPDLAPGRYVRLSVIDTGAGMRPEIVRKIFDPYFTTKSKGEGTGLGLAVVHGIVKSQGGAITVHSEPGKGARFEIFFPRIDRKIDQEQKEKDPLPTGNEHILLIDDEEILVEIGKEILEQLGYEVTPKRNSLAALEAFRENPGKFDLVITDMTMPLMTGEMLAKELMKIRPDIPIILCTGFSERITEKKAKAIGIREFVMKPLVMRDLAKTIRKILDEKG